VLSVVAGALGLVVGGVMIRGLGGTSAFLPPFEINPNAMALGGVLCIVLGLLAGLVPALSAMNLRITDALRRN